jgi:hypothetical protein
VNRIKKRLVSLLSVSLLMTAAGLTSALPALAAAPPCPEIGICLYRNTNYTGTIYNRPLGQLLGGWSVPPDGHCLTLAGTAADNMGNSAYNNSGHTVRFYTGTGCTGAFWHSFSDTSAPFTGAKGNLSRAVSSLLTYE